MVASPGHCPAHEQNLVKHVLSCSAETLAAEARISPPLIDLASTFASMETFAADLRHYSYTLQPKG